MNTQPDPKISTIPPIQIQLANVIGTVLAMSFFLPWFKLILGGVSGFMLGSGDGFERIVWLMPFLAVVTVVAGLAGLKQRGIGQLAGLCPFIFLAYALSDAGAKFLEAITIGGWLALISGAALFVITLK